MTCKKYWEQVYKTNDLTMLHLLIAKKKVRIILNLRVVFLKDINTINYNYNSTA